MPYIEQKDRNEKFGDLTTENLRLGYACETPGDLNYVITLICQQYIKSKGLRYQYVNDVVGALEGAKIEFYRRIVGPYEDEKIHQNGDVNILVAEGERVNENLHKYEKENFLDDEEDNIEVDGLSFYNNFQDCYRVLSRQSRIYNSLQYNQGYRKAEKDLDFDNDFNIIRDRFKSFTETETLSWIAGYVDKWSEYEGFDRATWVEGYDDSAH